VAIRPSAASETRELLDALTSADAVVRETASARLSAIGARVVPHLLDGFRRSSSPVVQASILKILESTHDRRGLALAIDTLSATSREPAIAIAALNLLGAFLDDDSTQALEALGAIVTDSDRLDLERLAAWQVLERMPDRILAPLRTRLAKDRSAALRRRLTAARTTTLTREPPLDPAEFIQVAAHGGAVDPTMLKDVLTAGGALAPLTVLHRLVEVARMRETEAATDADRHEWRAARAAVHLALASRASRVAVYDVRDTIAAGPGILPVDFIAAAALVGDSGCLEAIADALARVPARIDRQDQEWRDRLFDAARAIIARERLSRRHAAARRLARKHGAIARVLFAPAAGGGDRQ
jgi:hypothetical protein